MSLVDIFFELVSILRTLFFSLLAFFLAPKKKSLVGEWALITGAASGLGRLLSISLAKEGANLLLLDLNESGLAQLKKELLSTDLPHNIKINIYPCNLAQKPSVDDAMAHIKHDIGEGNLFLLVNNAGIVTGKRFLETPDSLSEKVMVVNTISHFWTVQAFLPGMIKNNRGHLVTIASSAAFVGVTGLADYCASKSAAFGFNESLRFELQKMGRTGVKTTCVCPYYINTGMFEGVKTRFPRVLPILEPEYVVEKITAAILTDAEVLVLPKICGILPALRILPTPVFDEIVRFLGVSSTMDEFRGRN